jgi:nicotinamidase-related amidase
MSKHGLVHGPLGGEALHLCVDMQGLFAAGGPWAVPWLEAILPAICELAGRHAERTIFTRFVPVRDPAEAVGMWRNYYRKWQDVTLAQLEQQELVDLVPALRGFAPPAMVVDKTVYSPWTEGKLDALLRSSSTTTLVITGGETDVCVLATVLGAMDRGFRVVLVEDAICSSADETHDALMTLYRSRFSEQIELASISQVIEAWR